MTLSNISSKARIWSGVFTELNSGFSDLQSGMQNSFRCLVAVNLCLAKRVNRGILAKCDTARKSRHFSQIRPATYHLPPSTATCHLPLSPATYNLLPLFIFKKKGLAKYKVATPQPPATCYHPPATCHLPPATNSKARTWSGVFTELNSGFSDLQWSCDEEYE